MPTIDLRGAEGRDAMARLGEHDVCIVGTGPAGATIAAELATSGLRVVVLESGGVVRDPETDRLNDIEDVGREREPDQWKVRNRVLGGSSHTWGGRCAPFDPEDFQQRDWVPASGWPLTFTELRPYLDRAAAHLGLVLEPVASDERRSATARPHLDPAMDPDLLQPFTWQFSRDHGGLGRHDFMRFGRHLRSRMGAATALVTSATVISVLTDDSGSEVRGVAVRSPDGHTWDVRARAVVLATGGVENARLLLQSDAAAPRGLGNDHDLVGRFLADHPRGTVGTFPVAGAAALETRMGRLTIGGQRYMEGFRLSPRLQQAEGLLNSSAWLGQEVAADDPWIALRDLLGGGDRGRGRAAAAVLRGSPAIARGGARHLVHRSGLPRRFASLTLDVMVEQRPDPASRITLSTSTDRLGQRLPRIDWRVHPDESRTVRRTAEVIASEFERLGLPAPALDDWVRAGEEMPAAFKDVAHPSGTTRMSDDPRTGVVDRHCEVHGVHGLHIAGSSVFPTNGHANPTETIVAMAVRLADRLVERAGDRAASSRIAGPSERSVP